MKKETISRTSQCLNGYFLGKIINVSVRLSDTFLFLLERLPPKCYEHLCSMSVSAWYFYFSARCMADIIGPCLRLICKHARKNFSKVTVRKSWCGNRLLGSGSFSVSLCVLRFYGPVNPMGSCRARSVYLTTRLLGRLSPLSG